jgi:hypothetical protein
MWIFFVQVSFENISYENLWHDTATNPASYVFAFYGAFWAYGGFDAVGFIVEEITQPIKRNIPLSVTFSIVVVIAIYVLRCQCHQRFTRTFLVQKQDFVTKISYKSCILGLKFLAPKFYMKIARV